MSWTSQFPSTVMPVDRHSVVFLPTLRAQAFISCSVCFVLMPSIPLSVQSSKAGCFLIPSLTFAGLPILQDTAQMPKLVMQPFLVLTTEYELSLPWTPTPALAPLHFLCNSHRNITATLYCSHLFYVLKKKKLSFNKHLNDWVCNLSCGSPRSAQDIVCIII